MSIDNFISAVKTKRDEAVEYFTSEEFTQMQASESPAAAAQKGIDQLVGGILDVLEERVGDITTAITEDGDTVEVTCVSDLSTLYFEEVSN